jgi:hypothetical protein
MRQIGKENDEVLSRFTSLWDDALSEEDFALLGKALRGFIMYVTRRYGSAEPFIDYVEPRLKFLESQIENMDDRSFLACSSTIGYARRVVKDSSRKFGAGFHNQPTGDTLVDVRTFDAPACNHSETVVPEDDSGLDPFDDNDPGDLDDDES